MNREQAIERAAQYFLQKEEPDRSWDHLGQHSHMIQEYYRREAEHFLLDAESLGYVQKCEDQALPKNPYHPYIDPSKRDAFNEGQQSLLTPDANGSVWVKVLK